MSERLTAVYPAEREAYLAIFEEIKDCLQNATGGDSEEDKAIGVARGLAMAGYWLAKKGKESSEVDSAINGLSKDSSQ